VQFDPNQEFVMAKPQKKKSSAPVAAPAAPATAPVAQALSSDRVAMRAYEIWQQSGCRHGQHEEHWFRAERELRTGASR
jgi:hypothetical protein